jgi:hypothetical protein
LAKKKKQKKTYNAMKKNYQLQIICNFFFLDKKKINEKDGHQLKKKKLKDILIYNQIKNFF